MIKTYHAVQQWEHWLGHFLGETLLKTEQHFLTKKHLQHSGDFALLIGAPAQHTMLASLSLTHQIVLSPLINKNKNILYIESAYKELPIATGSVDFVILPHTLEFVDNPRQLLHEACRIVKPEGDIMIFGFNPYSLWGLKKWRSGHKKIPWSGHFIPAHKVQHWLSLADFQLIRHDRLMYLPPLSKKSLLKKLAFLEWIGNRFNAYFGGVYAITAKAKVVPLTPIKLHWTQAINPLPISMPGHTMRDIS